MGRTEIKAVEMTRRIRADHSEQLRDATPEEFIEFYRDKAQWLDRELERMELSPEELIRIKSSLGRYHGHKAIQGADEVWEERGLTEGDLAAWLRE